MASFISVSAAFLQVAWVTPLPMTSPKRLMAESFRLGRLKTGTPARLDGKTIDYASLGVQPGDDEPVAFSYLTKAISTPQINCHITRTVAKTHQIIRDNMHKSAMYSGRIEGTGPRYCPSIEDKINRFGERDGASDLS